jgi:hypothetical protein
MHFSFSGPVSAVSGKKEKSLLGFESLIQVGSSLSADGVQPELRHECTGMPRPLPRGSREQ